MQLIPTFPRWFDRRMRQRLAILTLVLIDEAISLSFLFPIIAYQMALLVGKSGREAVNSSGYYAGLAVCILNFGQFLSGKMWARFSDTFGRVVPLQLGLTFTSVTLVMFGLSQTLWLAIFSRFLNGVFNGDITIAKIYCAEMNAASTAASTPLPEDETLDLETLEAMKQDQKQAEEFSWSMFSFGWNLGMILGPLVGGLLYTPPAHLLSDNAPPPTEEADFWVTYPALLPSLAIVLYKFTTLLFVRYALEESHADPIPLTWTNFRFFLRKNRYFDFGAKSSSQPVVVDSVVTPPPSETSTLNGEHNGESFGYRALFKDPVLRAPIIIYMLLTAVDFTFNELISLWMVSSPEKGGLGYLPSQVGTVVFFANVGGMAGNVIYPFVMKRWPNRLEIYQLNILWWAGLNTFIPLATMAFPTRGSAGLAVTILFSLRIFCDVFAFSTVFLFIATVSPPHLLGLMNGMAQALGALGRVVAPLVITPFFAWCLERKGRESGWSLFGPPIIDYYSAFVLLSILLVINYKLSHKLRGMV